ncbi:MAG TPA: hypothetical protein VK488_09495 [Gaiellaceae bacterium]|nr:hypothetical protein [Gaiellaceae bacterium]
MIWRLRLFLEKLRSSQRLGRKRVLAAVAVVAALVAAGAVFAVVHGGGRKAATTTAQTPALNTNLFYLQALASRTRVQRCGMYIHFAWKPNYHAVQYIGAPALILVSGTGIAGTYKKTFKASGMSLDVGPVKLGGGYKVWSAKVLSLDGDPPGNDTTVSAAPPTTTKCP